MIHADRTFCMKVMDAEDDLIEVLTNHKWSLCRAFDHEGLLYLNDRDREDAPVYAALKNRPRCWFDDLGKGGWQDKASGNGCSKGAAVRPGDEAGSLELGLP